MSRQDARNPRETSAQDTGTEPSEGTPLPNLRADYQHDGFVLVRNALDRDDVARARNGIQRALANVGLCEPPPAPPIWSGVPVEDVDTELLNASLYGAEGFLELTSSTRYIALLEFMVGEPVFVHRSINIRFALPHDKVHQTPAHQDGFFVGPNDDFLTTWIPLIPIGADAGGLSVARCSYKRGLLPHREVDAVSVIARGRGQRGVPIDAYDLDWVSLTYEPGDVLIFHPMTLHRGLPNRSNRLRLSLDVRAQPARTPLSWQATVTIPEYQDHRVRSLEILEAAGVPEEKVEDVLKEAQWKGIPADRKEMIRFAGSLGYATTVDQG